MPQVVILESEEEPGIRLSGGEPQAAPPLQAGEQKARPENRDAARGIKHAKPTAQMSSTAATFFLQGMQKCCKLQQRI